MNYQFTNDWFGGNVYEKGMEVDLRAIWTALLDAGQYVSILEIGSYEGNSTSFMIENCGKKHPVHIVCIDTWGGSDEHVAFDHDMNAVERRFDHNIQVAASKVDHEINVSKIKSTSYDGCAQLISQRLHNAFDLIYIDGSHTAKDVLTDAVMAFPLLKVGGLMVFDDYLWNFGFEMHNTPLKIPKMAVDAFTNIFYDKIKIIHGIPSYQLYLIKTAD